MIINNLKVIYISGIISTDDIIPGHYKHKYTDPKALAVHIFENKFPNLNKEIKDNTVLICDSTFGIGSSREQAVSSLIAAGIVAVIAPSFGRIFFRNSWNLGLISIEHNVSTLKNVNTLTLNLEENNITFSDNIIKFKKIPGELIDIYKCGGVLRYVKNFI